MEQYGLIGGQLSHSFSKPIHEALGGYVYALMPMPEDAVRRLFAERPFAALNVTIPYKQTVIPLCDEIDSRAAQIGAVNTVVNRDGRLFGYNTDFDGFLYMVRRLGVDPAHKRVMILGSGGTCKTVKAVMQYCGAGEVTVVSRRKSAGTVTYEEAAALSDTQILVNASPCGMYPENDGLPIDPACFRQLGAVFDVVYNPLRTRLMEEAAQRGIPHMGGLRMLVAQAKYASELFTGKRISDTRIEEIYRALVLEKANLVLCGMPSAGKTTLGKAAAAKMGRRFVDLDDEIVKETGMDIPSIFEQKGEAWFRQREAAAAARLSKENGLVLACGGGTVLREENVRRLKQNGTLCLIDRPLPLLAGGNGRPLAQNAKQVAALYEARMPVYRACADFVVAFDGEHEASAERTEKEIEERFYETACD